MSQQAIKYLYIALGISKLCLLDNVIHNFPRLIFFSQFSVSSVAKYTLTQTPHCSYGAIKSEC